MENRTGKLWRQAIVSSTSRPATPSSSPTASALMARSSNRTWLYGSVMHWQPKSGDLTEVRLRDCLSASGRFTGRGPLLPHQARLYKRPFIDPGLPLPEVSYQQRPPGYLTAILVVQIGRL